ncbi:MAG: hypothetical protein EOS32_21065 [Mesorhizobium sp.]|uniref:GIY-YIG nuclease family protein n=1 Tax=Mesorhizobium sp. TaxID=1871066 RepID=UPI000FE5F37D|nr:MAG: hypothetical protein EOS32_21065 [Mesorhizobium sp.]
MSIQVDSGKFPTANRLSRWAPDHAPVVYFVKRDDGFIKIGTTRNLDRRLYQLSVSYRPNGGPKRQFELLGTIPGGADEEARIHQIFKDKQAPLPGSPRNEFFHDCPQVRRFIAANCHRGKAAA